MSNIILRFTTKWPPNPTSLIIARLGGSKLFSHCMNIIDGIAYEATMLNGCRAVLVEEAMHGVSAYQDMLIPVKDKIAAVKFGQDQDGKGYDFAGAFGLPLLASEDWGDDSKWWCSELAFMQLGVGGTWLLDPTVVKRVTPAHLLMCNYKRTGLIKVKP